tara:strand:+ start:63 stop:1148 length:1086 start_codon:yes stop_codon:yes gene_type:complete
MLGFSVLIALYAVFYVFLFTGWKGISKTKKTTGENVTLDEITLVIPFRNEYENLKSLLKTLDTLSTTPKEIIFINDHSDDDWKRLFEERPSHMSIYYLDEKERGKKAAVLLGIQKAQSDYVLCWDADVDVEPEYFQQIQKIPEADLMILPVQFRSKNTIQAIGEIDFYLANFVNQASTYWLRPIMCNGANLLVKRAAYLEVIALNEHVHVMSGDDMFLLRNMTRAQKNIQLVSSEHCIVRTNSPNTLKAYLRQRSRWMGKSFYIQDGLLLFWAGIQFTMSVSFLVLFAYWAFHDLKLFLLFFAVKSLLDLSFLIPYFSAIQKKKLLSFMPIYGLIFPFYNLLILLSFFYHRQEWKGRKLYQ